MKNVWLKNLRDIIILPFTVTCVVPYYIYDAGGFLLPDMLPLKITGGILMACGVSLVAYTVFLFNLVGKGTLAPWSPKERLVVQGPYRYCRNPMITGVLFILIGEALIFNSISILLWSVLFFSINTLYFILIEEPGLAKRFGENYRNYREHVPRWIPNIRPYKEKC